MSENKPGDVLGFVAYQADDNGEILSKVTVETYGYDRAVANAGTFDSIDTIVAMIKKWEAARKGGKPKR